MKKLCILLLICAAILCVAAFSEQTTLTATVPATHTLTVSFGAEGSLDVNGTTLSDGESLSIARHAPVRVVIAPADGYELDKATLSLGYGASLDGNVLTIAKMVADLTLAVAFKEAEAPAPIPGDANGDNQLTLSDGLLILQYEAGWKVSISLELADVNGDNRVNASDATLIFRYLSGENVTLQ